MTATATLPTATTGRLVTGDDVEYVGSVAEYVGRSFCVEEEVSPATALVLACMAEGARVPDDQRRYTITSVSLGVTLTNVRRQSLRLLGV